MTKTNTNTNGAHAMLPDPCDILGLDRGGKFDSWRKYQDRAVMDAIESKARFVVQVMPTGSGKSLAYVVNAMLSDARAAVLTSTKALQNQLHDDFEPVGMKLIKGQNAYPCRAVDEPHHDPPHLINGARVFRLGHARDSDRRAEGCEAGPCHAGVQCRLKDTGCHYYDAFKVAQNARLLVTNYAYWMAVHQVKPDSRGNRAKSGMLPRHLLILDEAHNAPEALSSFLTVRVERYDVDRVLKGAKFLHKEAAEDQWREWAEFWAAKAEVHLDSVDQSIRQVTGGTGEGHNITTNLPIELLRESRSLRKVISKLKAISTNTDMVVDQTGDGAFEFSPVWPGAKSESALFLGVPKVVLVSATVREKTLKQLGVSLDHAEVFEYKSTFPVKNRRVTHIPTVRMNFRTTESDLRILLARVDAIIGARLDRKGIIHTVSFSRARWLVQRSKYAHLMMTHDGAGTGGIAASSVVERFKKAKGPVVLVSPSMTTGYDFPGDECRYQLILKVPYPDTRSKLVQARIANDRDYPTYVATQDLVQACGRGVRSEDDWCETFILDDCIKWVLWGKGQNGKRENYAPKWFMESFESKALVPKPPPVDSGP